MTASAMPALPPAGSARDRFGSFVSPELERDFARYMLPQGVPQERIVILVMTVATAFFAVSDYQLFGLGPLFWGVAAVRGALVAFGLGALLVLRHDPSAERLRRVSFAYALAISVFAMVLAPSRPPTALTYPLSCFSILLLTYLAVPIPRRLQVWPATIVSLAIVWWAMSGGTVPMVKTSAATIILAGNLIGYIISGQLDGWQRVSFLTMREKSETLARLEQALAEVTALRGILPICSHCKSVRDDSGYWHEVEVYMRAHSEAEFSHSICPDCLQVHYPEHAEPLAGA